MRKKTGFYVIVALVGLIAVAGLCFAAFQIGIIVERNIPSKTVMSLQTYFEEQEGESVAVILQDRLQEKKGLLRDGRVYLDFDTVCGEFAKRFYIDEYENLLLFTTPTEVIHYDVGNNKFSINGEEKALEYIPAVWVGEVLYMALDYVKDYVSLDYAYYPDPNRVVVSYKTGEYTYADAKKEASVRLEPDIKTDIVAKLEKGDTVLIIEREDGEEFSKVMTEDGVTGYISSKRLTQNEIVAKTYETNAEYTSLSMEEPVKLVWHQVFNLTANTYLEEKLENVKGANVISPTWFSVENNQGRLAALASKEYVELAHGRGLQVWPLVDDFNTDVDFAKLLGSTTTRTKLIRNIMYFIREFNLDGINIDFERVTEENAVNYIQFLRELSIECRKAEAVLSVDNYVPFPHTVHYDRAEQGVLADYVVVMAYDEHYAGSETAGSVSSLNWVKLACERTMEEVSADKMIIGLPFYTRLWKESTQDGKKVLKSEACSMSAAEKLLEDNGVEPEWLEEEGQYYGEYEKEGVTYRIWLEEEESFQAKLDLVSEYKTAGLAFWKLGLEKPEVWNEIKRYDIE